MARSTIQIRHRSIGTSHPAFIIAEVAQSHDGSLGMAHAFIDAAAEAKADAVKFQTHIASAESTHDEPFRVRFSQQDTSRFEYWRRMEFTAEQWQGLAAHASERNLVFLSSAFSVEAVILLKDIGVAAWKVGSGEVRSHDLLEAMVGAGGPMLVSSGMSLWSEIDAVVDFLRTSSTTFVLMQCTSRYPTTLELVGLNVLDEMRRRYHCPVGLSDHSGKPFPALAAMARGAEVIEVHVTFHRQMFGPDIPSSITFEELSFLARARDAFFVMDSHPVDKDVEAEKLLATRQMFGKSLAAVRPLPEGTVLSADMLTTKKPAVGIPPEARTAIVGRRLAREVIPDRVLRWDDLEEERS